MHPTAAENFDLMLWQLNPHEFRAHAQSSFGEVDETLELHLEDLESRANRVWNPLQEPTSSPSPAYEATQQFGETLFRAVFRGSIRDSWMYSLGKARAREIPLRTRLQLRDDAGRLVVLPWEFLYWEEGVGFLARSQETPIVRVAGHRKPSQTLPVTPPLRVLVLPSSPEGYPEVKAKEEIQGIRESLAKLGSRWLVQLECLEDGQLETLRRFLVEKETIPHHVFHFVGHGFFDPREQEGGCLFETPHREGTRVYARDLAPILASHPSFRLAILSACHSGTTRAGNTLSGTAQRLAHLGMPAVVAMQNKIKSSSALGLTSAFYHALVQNHSIDRSLVEARNAISETDSFQWGIPALFSCSPDNRLFRVDFAPTHPLANDLQRIEDLLEAGDPHEVAWAITKLRLGRLERPPIELSQLQYELELLAGRGFLLQESKKVQDSVSRFVALLKQSY